VQVQMHAEARVSMRGSKLEDTLKRSLVCRLLFARTKKSLDNPPRLINTPTAGAAFDEVLIAT